ncbi:MAG: hypothetical protein QM831_18525 [Kofleriaceae bacterium]
MGEVTLAAGLLGILATVATAELVPSHDSDILRGGVVFVPISLTGAFLYAAVDAEVNKPTLYVPTPEERAFESAMDIAKEAKRAARAGDCASVQAAQPRIRDLNDRVYRRFLHESVIRACLDPATIPEGTPPAKESDPAPPSAGSGD